MSVASGIHGTKRLAGLIGQDAKRSMSPRMHDAAFAAAGPDRVHLPLRGWL